MIINPQKGPFIFLLTKDKQNIISITTRHFPNTLNHQIKCKITTRSFKRIKLSCLDMLDVQKNQFLHICQDHYVKQRLLTKLSVANRSAQIS